MLGNKIIIFEKLDENNNILSNWTRIFYNTDELLKFMEENSKYLLGEDYTIRIRQINNRR